MSTHGTHTSGEKPATAGCKDDSSVRVSPVSGDDYGHQYDQGGELKKGFGRELEHPILAELQYLLFSALLSTSVVPGSLYW